MDLGAVKAAGRAELSACAFAVARNVLGLLHDAELLAAAGRTARAYSLAALAVEECGKAACLLALAVLPKSLRTRAPTGRMLQWHQLKQVGGLLVAAMLAARPAAQATQILATLNAPADEADRLRRRGVYVDMDSDGRIREPSEITEAELASQLARARQAAASAAVMLGPDMQARLANPPAEVIELATALISALVQAGNTRTPKDAADILLTAVSNLRDSMAIKNAQRGKEADSTRTGCDSTDCWR